jgi:hypothetical protein
MPYLGDRVLGLDAELLLGLHLGGQAVAVPAEAALDALAAHGLVAGDDVLDVAGQQVAVVRQAVGEGRAVVEDVLVVRLGRASTEASKVRGAGRWRGSRPGSEPGYGVSASVLTADEPGWR